jgi:hypothetical protein
LLEFRSDAGDVEPLEEMPSVQRERFGQMAFRKCALEFVRVTPELVQRHADLLVAPADDDATAQGLTEKVEALPEGSPGLLDVRLGPEERKERIAPMQSCRRCEREVGEEGQSFRLNENRPQLITFRTSKIQRTEGVEMDDWRSNRTRVAVIRQVTVE